jgi:hypothetical protein
LTRKESFHVRYGAIQPGRRHPEPDKHARKLDRPPGLVDTRTVGVDTVTAMKITGRRTLRIFMRYNIISTGQLHEAMDKVTSKKKAAK